MNHQLISQPLLPRMRLLGSGIFVLLILASVIIPKPAQAYFWRNWFKKKIPTAAAPLVVHRDSLLSAWHHYQIKEKNNSGRESEFRNRKIMLNGLSMRYEFKKFGSKPPNGYPLYIALHGGGGTSPAVNDSQWQEMTKYYQQSVDTGIYLAPRGITNSWNLHFVDESYPIYDRLIENMILFADVDPNQVYLLGFSAGGDAVYQISARMSDRFAAANMSAGHPNGVSLKNLYHLPFMIQVGQLDSAFERNRVGAESCLTLDNLRRQYPDGYQLECNIHYLMGHNFFDNHPTPLNFAVLADPNGWLAKSSHAPTVRRDTNAIRWLKKFTRDPIPPRVIWDLTTRANRSKIAGHSDQFSHGMNYWLDIGDHTAESLGTSEIIVRYERAQNKIVVEKSAPYLKILLKQEMLDLNQPIKIAVDDQTLEIRVAPSASTLAKTLEDRGDINYCFEVAILIEKDPANGNLFKVSQVD